MYYYGLRKFFKKNTIFLSVIRKIITTFALEWWFKNTPLAWGRIEKGIRCKSGTESPAVSSCNLDFAQHKSFFPDRKREDKQNRNKSEDLPIDNSICFGKFEQIGKSFFNIIYKISVYRNECVYAWGVYSILFSAGVVRSCVIDKCIKII